MQRVIWLFWFSHLLEAPLVIYHHPISILHELMIAVGSLLDFHAPVDADTQLSASLIEDLLPEDTRRTLRMRVLLAVRVTMADDDEGDLGNNCQVKATRGQAWKTGEF
jgi:hypothetical protein